MRNYLFFKSCKVLFFGGVKLILTGGREEGEGQKGRLIEFIVGLLQTDRYTPCQAGDRRKIDVEFSVSCRNAPSF